jgi:hypothetical protein
MADLPGARAVVVANPRYLEASCVKVNLDATLALGQVLHQGVATLGAYAATEWDRRDLQIGQPGAR